MFENGGNTETVLAVYRVVARQILVPFALLSVVPVTVVILFALLIESPEPIAPKAKKTADSVSAVAAEES